MKIKIKKFKKVRSTNDIALKLIKKNILEPTLITTDNQTNGRGRAGKKWVSNKGNLFFSLFFKFDQKKIDFKQFAILNALILKYVISKTIPKKIKIKWPNDLLIKNMKVCGILQELIKFEKKFFLIIGIGINTAYSPKNRSFKCISLQETSDKLISNIDILLKLKKNYETIFYNYKYNKKLLKA